MRGGRFGGGGCVGFQRTGHCTEQRVSFFSFFSFIFFSFLANVLFLQYQNFSNNNYCFINPVKVR